jgi:hypothetical protein
MATRSNAQEKTVEKAIQEKFDLDKIAPSSFGDEAAILVVSDQSRHVYDKNRIDSLIAQQRQMGQRSRRVILQSLPKMKLVALYQSSIVSR